MRAATPSLPACSNPRPSRRGFRKTIRALGALFAAVVLFGEVPALAQTHTVGLTMSRTSGLEGSPWGYSNFSIQLWSNPARSWSAYYEVDFTMSTASGGDIRSQDVSGKLTRSCDRNFCTNYVHIVYVHADTVVEPDEVITITLSNPRDEFNRFPVALAQTTYTYTIVNDDESAEQRAYLRVHNDPQREGGDFRIEAEIVGTKAWPTIFHVTATPDSGTDPSDFTLSGTTITVPRGVNPVSTGWLTLTANQDDDKKDEYLTIDATVSGAGSGRIPGRRVSRSERVRIIDDDRAPCPGPGDPPPTLHFSMSPTTVSEDPTDHGNMTKARVWINGKVCNRTKVEVRAVPGSGTAEPGDWIQQPAYVVYLHEGIDPVGTWEPPVFAVQDDDVDDETFEVAVTVVEAGHESIVAPPNQTVTIRDDDSGEPEPQPTPTVTLAAGAASLNEGQSTTLTMTVDGFTATEQPTTLTLTGSPSGSEDFSLSQSSFTLDTVNSVQRLVRTATFTAVADGVVDASPREQVTVTATLSGGLTGSSAPVTITIVDTDEDSEAQEGQDQVAQGRGQGGQGQGQGQGGQGRGQGGQGGQGQGQGGQGTVQGFGAGGDQGSGQGIQGQGQGIQGQGQGGQGQGQGGQGQGGGRGQGGQGGQGTVQGFGAGGDKGGGVWGAHSFLFTPATLDVADARVREARGASLGFVVTLSRELSAAATVDYATADGSARAGADYSAASGTLTFAPGETRKTVEVAVLDDVHDEGVETMGLRLSNASGAVIGDSEATGSIENSDVVPEAWLARYGRTVANHVIDAVGGRANAPAGAGPQVTLAGTRIPLDGDGTDALTLAPVWSEPADWRHWADDWPGPVARLQSGRQALLGSSFRLGLGESTGASGARWTGWGRAMASRFDGKADELAIDGEATTVVVGADVERSNWLAGLAVGFSTGEGRYLGGEPGSGKLENTLTSVHPYVRLRVDDRLSAWGVVGYGTGEMDFAPDSGKGWTTDTTMTMAAMGARSVLIEPPRSGGFGLAARADAVAQQTTSDAARGEGGQLAETSGRTTSFRLVLEGARSFRLGGGILSSGFETGLRYDGGDAETGAGIVLGGSVGYSDPASGFSLGAKAYGLLAHGDSDYDEWGVSGRIQVGRPGGRGLSFSLRPVYGASERRVETLWDPQYGLAGARTASSDGAARLEGRLGYGFRAGPGTAAPYVEFTVGGAVRDHRAGIRWSNGGRLALSLEGVRRDRDGSRAEHGVMMIGHIRF